MRGALNKPAGDQEKPIISDDDRDVTAIAREHRDAIGKLGGLDRRGSLLAPAQVAEGGASCACSEGAQKIAAVRRDYGHASRLARQATLLDNRIFFIIEMR